MNTTRKQFSLKRAVSEKQYPINLKRRAPAPLTCVAGYCNGYIYYLPTEQQRGNTGYAQEDCDCLVAPEWQKLFETKALEILKKL
jgi:hypothetical protein